MTTRFQRIVLTLSLVILLAGDLHAQPLVNIETVAVGDPGNAALPDLGGGAFGSVAYEYQIGKYEITIAQYTTFLNSVASVTSDLFIRDLWNPGMANQDLFTNLNSLGISRSGSGTLAEPYVYAPIGTGSRPVSRVGWLDAARFANWVNNGATNGASTETGAYTLNGVTNGIIQRNPGATWVIPNEDEWVKAAYYKGGGTNAGYWLYPMRSDTAPGNTIGGAANQANYRRSNVFTVTRSTNYSAFQDYLTPVGAFGGSASAYGTFDQGGNVSEWNESVWYVISSDGTGGQRGGNWFSDASSLEAFTTGLQQGESSRTGFRLATVPEPSTYALLLMTTTATLWHLRRRR